MSITWPVGKVDKDAYTSSQNVDYIKGLCKLSILYLSQMLNFTHSDQTVFSFCSIFDVSCVLFKATIVAIFQERWYIFCQV